MILRENAVRPAGTQSYDADGRLVGLILEAAVEGIVFVTDDKTIPYINQAGREILHC
jgi:hypothetical protein